MYIQTKPITNEEEDAMHMKVHVCKTKQQTFIECEFNRMTNAFNIWIVKPFSGTFWYQKKKTLVKKMMKFRMQLKKMTMKCAVNQTQWHAHWSI